MRGRFLGLSTTSRLRVLFAAFAFSATLHGATAASDGAKPIDGGVLNIGLGTDTAVIDPSITGNSITAVITRNIVDSLVGQAENNDFTPWLAERWEVSEANKLYTFYLRKGVTFSDGTPLDAAAVKYNFDRILDPATTSSYARSLLGPVDKVEAVDTQTLVIRYRESFAPLLQGLSLPYLGIQSPTYLKKAANTTNTVVGSGPYILSSFAKGSGSKLYRRADYNWGPGYAAHAGPAHFAEIDFKYLPEASVRLGALASGQVQAIDAVPPANFRSVQINSSLQVVTKENPGVSSSFLLNTSKHPFDDLKVRQAFQSAIDVASAVKVAYLGTLKPADNVLAPSTLYYDASLGTKWGFNADRANRLLDEAGWSERDSDSIRRKNGQRLTLRYVYDSALVGDSDVTLAQAAQYQARQVGFDLQLDPVDAGEFIARTNANNYDLVSLNYVRAEPDILRTVFHSAFAPPNGANFARISSLDEKLTKAIGSSDAERKRLYGEIQEEIVEQAYVVPRYVAAYQLGASKKLLGINWATNAKPNFYDAWLSP
ncbi:ABC transporter substrate-binding protein [Rhizobium leguminosarum]|uniref:ABC transporter substrate-binding protein n=1 Tax=Rhizobium leguminosarum TaxID=384 RepID=UPI001C975F4C|nr:ABC transporter substrate-binding protein [Rhizobium leguminosarum]MBY5768551.1 ABC transporter substrate-binding protein [Rhizobium leguminosarum]